VGGVARWETHAKARSTDCRRNARRIATSGPQGRSPGLRVGSIHQGIGPAAAPSRALAQWRDALALLAYRCGGSAGFACTSMQAHRLPVSTHGRRVRQWVTLKRRQCTRRRAVRNASARTRYFTQLRGGRTGKELHRFGSPRPEGPRRCREAFPANVPRHPPGGGCLLLYFAGKASRQRRGSACGLRLPGFTREVGRFACGPPVFRHAGCRCP